MALGRSVPHRRFQSGAYHSVQRNVGKTTVEVYATREAEAALEERHARRMLPHFLPRSLSLAAEESAGINQSRGGPAAHPRRLAAKRGRKRSASP